MRCRGRPLPHLAYGAAPLLAFAACVFDVLPARAQTTTPLLELTWSAPAGCPDRAQVVAHVEALVGERRAGQHPLSARGRIVGTSPRRYRLELLIDTPGIAGSSTRTMSGDDCAKLADAAALVLALDIDPDAGTPRGETTGAPATDAPASDQIDPEVPALRTPERAPPLRLPRRARPSPPPPPTPPHFEGFAGLRFLFDSGSLPRPTLGIAVASELVRGAFALDLQAAVYQSQFTITGPHHGVGGAYVSLATLGALACWGGVAGEVDFRGCAGGELGRDGTTGVSIAHPESSASLWSALSAMIRARVWPERVVSPTVGLGAAHPLAAPSVTIHGFGTVFDPPAVVIRLFLGVEAHFF